MKKYIPGYELTEMIMTDDSWYVVRNTPGVTCFVGSSGQGAKPIPLLPDEVDAILSRMGVEQPTVKIEFELKDNVTVTDGPFANFTGTIEHIDIDRQTGKVHVNMLGRETPVELDFTLIGKMQYSIK